MTTITVDIIAEHFYDISSSPGTELIYTIFDFADIGLRNQVANVQIMGTIGFPANHASGVFTNPADMAAYYFTASAATLITEINTAQSVFTYVAGNMLTVDEDTQILLNTKQGQNSNLDKLSAVTLANSSVFATDATSANVLQLPLSSFTTRTTSAISPSLVGTGATGTQVHATKDSSIKLNVSTSTTASIGAASTSIVALKICSTNNATEASWTTVATLENDQTITLAITLNSVQVFKGQIVADLPAGWYYKLVNSGSGTHSESALTGQQTIFG